MPSVLAVPVQLDLRRTVGVHRTGGTDPTTVVRPDEAWLARWTPDGPGTLHLRLDGTGAAVQAWGPGGPWLAERAPEVLGLTLEVPAVEPHHPQVADALRRVRGLRRSRLALVHPALVAAVLGQRITTEEAQRQWRALCRALGEPAPGPDGLRLPPHPERLAQQPYWWFHRFGIERRRADVLRAVGRLADRLEAAADLDGPGAEARLRYVPGIGAWSAAKVRESLGDPDALAVGDYHLCHIVTHALTGRPRGSDDEMLALLAPYAGHRGWVVRHLLADGWSAPAFGPRRALLPVARW